MATSMNPRFLGQRNKERMKIPDPLPSYWLIGKLDVKMKTTNSKVLATWKDKTHQGTTTSAFDLFVLDTHEPHTRAFTAKIFEDGGLAQ